MPSPTPSVPEEWCLCLSFLRSGHEEDDWSRLSQEVRWLPDLPFQERMNLCQALTSHGAALLPCGSRDEAKRRCHGVRGERVQAVVCDSSGREVARQPPASLRQRFGIYPTPPALTAWVVRSVHALLRSRLGRAEGLADPELCLLDPAAGDMNFVLEACRLAIDHHRQAHGARGLAAVVQGLPQRFQGFELTPDEHLRGLRACLEFFAAQGHSLKAETAPLHLADALAGPGSLTAGGQGGSPSVIVGNPPWRGRSSHRGRWMAALLRGYQLANGHRDEGYFRVDGQPLGERNSKWLLDDYVKFLRLAQWTIDQKGAGLVALVVNHNALDAPTFRGLRRSLLRSFDEIYAFDLHGNRRRRETTPDGEPDENVFESIAQGAAVLLLVKNPDLPKRILRADLFGLRPDKLRQLDGGSVETTPWQQIHPRSPLYLFVAADERIEREYRRGLALPDIFPVRSAGVVTGRDALVTGLDRREIEERLVRLRADEADSATLAPGWRLRLQEDAGWQRHLTGYLSRPFDVRYLVSAPYLLERSRIAVMRHMRSGANVGLIVPRQAREGPAALVSLWMAGHKAVSAYDINTLFPLYLYPDGAPERVANLAPAVWNRLGELYGERPEPEVLLGFIYAVLYSPAYRIRYRELLGRDFPRIPFPQELSCFRLVAELGAELLGLHLFSDPRLLATPGVQVGGDLDRPIGRCIYKEDARRILASEAGPFFNGIEPAVWRYRIGGYTVLSHWLKARTGRALTWNDIGQFRRIAEVLRLTIEIQDRLANVYESATDNLWEVT